MSSEAQKLDSKGLEAATRAFNTFGHNMSDVPPIAAAISAYLTASVPPVEGVGTVTDEMVDLALHARVPGGSQVWVWLPQEDAYTPHQTARDVMRCALEAVLPSVRRASLTVGTEPKSAPQFLPYGDGEFNGNYCEDTLRSLLYETKTLLADLSLGRSIHNDRFPDRKVEGPLWNKIGDLVRRCETALATPPPEPSVQKPVAWQWRALEDGKPATQWNDLEIGDRKGWEALAKRSHGKYAIERLALVVASPHPSGDRGVKALRDALERCVAYISSPVRMSRDEDETARRSAIIQGARSALTEGADHG